MREKKTNTVCELRMDYCFDIRKRKRINKEQKQLLLASNDHAV
jgi:hypothetical protein